MNQSQMIALRCKAVSKRSNDEIIKNIMIGLMIATAISVFMCYMPLFLDAASKSSSGGGTVTKIVNDLTQGLYDEAVGTARPIAAFCLVAWAFCHFGRPGSVLDRMLQGWPARIIVAFFVIAFAPTLLDYIENLLKNNGLFVWKS